VNTLHKGDDDDDDDDNNNNNNNNNGVTNMTQNKSRQLKYDPQNEAKQ
jgi:hypothetical protein